MGKTLCREEEGGYALNQYKKAVDKMVWSYSRLTSFEHCKYEFYLNYLLSKEDRDLYIKEGNYYAEVGSFVHKILAMIFEGKMTPEEATQYYIDHFNDNVFYVTRQSTMDKTYESCANYFVEGDFTWLNDYKILGVEKECHTQIQGYSFVGFIDLLLKDKSDGKIIIADNKSSPYPFRLDGKVKVNSKDNFEKYKKQMYLYSVFVHDEYGEYPKQLAWNHFKDGGRFAVISFEKEEYNQAVKWMINTIHNIEKEENFEACDCKHEFFYCHQLCNFRSSCEYVNN